MIRNNLLIIICVTFIIVTLTSITAFAHGNYSHLWISNNALNYLEEGELNDILSKEELIPILLNGSMYPDGGYAVKSAYGETSHWEPFHMEYLDWIRTNYSPPWSGEAKKHITFLMGMASHGIADQLYDGMYLHRHEYYDDPGLVGEEPMGGVDGATDACFAVTQGPMEAPEVWAPYADLAPLYEKFGITVKPNEIEQGQLLVSAVISYSSGSSENPSTMASYNKKYPWACANQNNKDIPGSPPSQGTAIANYWKVLWAHLHNEELTKIKLLDSFYVGGFPWELSRDHTTPESWVSFALPFGLDNKTVTSETVVVSSESGETHPVKVHVYYGKNSHLVNLKPKEDWAENTDYTVTVSPSVASWDGRKFSSAVSFNFSTKDKPVNIPDGDEDSEENEMEINETDIEVPERSGNDKAEDTSTNDNGCQTVSNTGIEALILGLFIIFCAIYRKNNRSKFQI